MSEASTGALVRKLRKHPRVMGLIEYGGARHTDREIPGDYDLFAVLTDAPSGVESLHFFVSGVSVDLNVTTLERILAMPAAVGFDAVLVEGRIIHDDSGRVSEAISQLRRRTQSTTVRTPPGNVSKMRHGHRHILDKVRNRMATDPVLCSYLLHQSVYWLLPQYFELRGKSFPGEKRAMEHIRSTEPEMYNAFRQVYAAADLQEQVACVRSLAQAVLAPAGGLWRTDELLVFGDVAEGEKLFTALLGDWRLHTGQTDSDQSCVGHNQEAANDSTLAP